MEKTVNPMPIKKTLTDYLRLWFKWFLDPLGGFFNRLGITPNMMTMLGLLGNTVGAYFLARGEMLTGGLFVLLMTPIDALDGTMARLRGESSDFGAFVDSVTDRYSELIIYGGLLYHFLYLGEPVGGLLVFGAAAGSVLVSYVKARAEGLGYEAKVGLLTRVERYLVLAPVFGFQSAFHWACDHCCLCKYHCLAAHLACPWSGACKDEEAGDLECLKDFLLVHLKYGFTGSSLCLARWQEPGWQRAKPNAADMNPEIVWDLLTYLLIGGIIGARLWHILTPPPSSGITAGWYFTHPLDALAIWKGGLGIPGAVIGGHDRFVFLRSQA